MGWFFLVFSGIVTALSIATFLDGESILHKILGFVSMSLSIGLLVIAFSIMISEPNRECIDLENNGIVGEFCYEVD